MMKTNQINEDLYGNYLYHLVGRFYKILPLKEDHSPTLEAYITSLQIDLIGCQHLMDTLEHDARFLVLINTLEFFLTAEYDIQTCKREVMKCIGIIKALYANATGREWAK